MDITTNSNITSASFSFSSINLFTENNTSSTNNREEIVRIVQSTIASVGIVTNLTVIVVFLNHKKLRRKIPNIFIINQVRYILLFINKILTVTMLLLFKFGYQWLPENYVSKLQTSLVMFTFNATAETVVANRIFISLTKEG